MNIVLNGEKITVPLCSCGKCVLRRTRDNNKANYAYNEKMSSTYDDHHDEKPMGKSAIYFNRSKRDNFDVSYKEHLPSLLISTMKFDYKPYKVQIESNKKELVKIKTMPFFGNSTYSSFFPNWNCSQKNDPKSKLPFLKVPFRGNSTYGDNFFKRKLPINKLFKPFNNLEFKGKFYGQPNLKFDDYDKNAYLNDRADKNQNEKCKIIPADYPKNFDSTYNVEFSEADSECNLAKFLKKTGMKNLEI
jgi:hypothetical protein